MEKAPAGAGRTVRTTLASLSAGGPGTDVQTAARPEGLLGVFLLRMSLRISRLPSLLILVLATDTTASIPNELARTAGEEAGIFHGSRSPRSWRFSLLGRSGLPLGLPSFSRLVGTGSVCIAEVTSNSSQRCPNKQKTSVAVADHLR